MNKTKKIFFSILVLIFSFAISIFFGAENFSFQQIKNIFLHDTIESVIFLNIRLPRSVLVFLCGALLASSGAVFQGFFRNSLADSSIIGIASAASLGAVLSELFPIAFSSHFFFLIHPTTIFAFAFSLCASFLIYIIATKIISSSSTVSLLLVGTALSTFFSALTSFIILMRNQEMYKMYVWSLGSFSGKTWDDFLFAIFPAVTSFVLLGLCAAKLDVLAFGEKSAQTLGLDIKKSRVLILCAGSLAASTSVCTCGTVGFVGLVAPHIVRKIFGPLHKTLVPLSAIWGAIMLLISDTIARLILRPAEIPIGIITSLIGAPFFIYIIISKQVMRND